MSENPVTRRQIHIVDHFISESLSVSFARCQEEVAQLKRSIASLGIGGDSFRTMAINFAESFLKGGHRDDFSQIKDLTIAYTAAAMALTKGTDLSQDWVLQRVGIPIQSNPYLQPTEVIEFTEVDEEEDES